MEWIFIVFVFLLVMALVMVKQKTLATGNFVYRKRPTLFTPAEVRFLAALDEAVSDHYRVFGKVRVADVISPEKGMNRSDWQVAFNKVSSKHFDYVLCEKTSLTLVAVIELDDRSHSSKKAKARDSLLESACTSASLPLIRFPASESYDRKFINDTVEAGVNS